MNLEEEIAEAQTYINDPPGNESNTCEWIILPLLWSLGYTKRKIVSRRADSAKKIPDYTILPDISSATWYLEAKAWNEMLEEPHDHQALNYANQNGKRFVVLTNGQLWRLYDNAVQGLLADKLIDQGFLKNTEQIRDFLTMLSKTEVLSGCLERLAKEVGERKEQANREREEQRIHDEEKQYFLKRQSDLRLILHSTLPESLSDPNSNLVLLMALALNEQEIFHDLAPETLASWFDEILSQPPDNWQEETVILVSTPLPQPPLPTGQGITTLTLKALQNLTVDGKNSRPITLHTPDGTQIAVRSWVGLAEEAIRWLLQQSRPLPIPFESGHRTRWFLNSSPVHKNQNIRKQFKSISSNGKTVYMDSDRSAEMLLHDIFVLCLKMQIAPEEFRITYEKVMDA